MSKIYAFIEFLITVVLRSSANTRSVLNRFRVWRWLNEPMSESCAPIVRWWNAKAELANSDRNRYFMSARRRYGIFGYGLYTQYQPIILTDEYNTEIEELMKFRYKHESSFFMGGRFEVMAYIKGLRNSDFDNAITMDEFRAARFTAYIDAFCADTMNHQSLFRHWLSVQVRTGKLTEIDGYIFTGATKNCEIGAFLYKYFDTFETAHAVGLHQGYRSPEHLAQYLIKELQKAALGLTDSFEFECINTKLRDYTERNKASQIAVTDLGNVVEANVVKSLSSTTYDDDFIGVKPASPWPRKPMINADFDDDELGLSAVNENTTQSIASMPEAFRLHKGNVLKSSVPIELDDICSINSVLFTNDAFSDISKLLYFSENKRELRFYNTIMPGLGAVIKLKQSRKFFGAVFTVTDIADTNESPFIAIANALTDEVQQSNNAFINEFIADSELVVSDDKQALKDSTLNITFTTKSTIALDKPFDFTDVLGIFLNGDEVDISRKSTNIIDSLRAAGITFTDNHRYLHYTPANKYVDSIVLQLKKTSDVKTKAEFTVVAKRPVEVELTPEIRNMPGMDALIESLDTSDQTLAAGIKENLDSESAKELHESLEEAGVSFVVDAETPLCFITQMSLVDLNATIISVRYGKTFNLSPDVLHLKNAGLVLSDDGFELSFVKLPHNTHDHVTIYMMSDADVHLVSKPEMTEFLEQAEIRGLANKVSKANGRLNPSSLTR